MKNRLNKALAVLAILITTAQVQAYSYIFSNHTNKKIGVGMRFYGLGEPRYFRWIPAHQARQFTPGQPTRTSTEREIEYRKIGFVAKTWWYVTNPTPSQKRNSKALPWREFQITWLPTEAHELAINLCEAVGAATVEAAKIALDAAIALSTEGASVPVQAAIKAAQEGVSTLKKSPAAGAPTTRAYTKNAEPKTAVLKTIQNGIVSDALSQLMSAVGKSAARSMMTDRHIDIIEDKGQIKFISQL